VDDSIFAATVDLRLIGGQIVVQDVFDSSAARIVHAIIGGAGVYRGARGAIIGGASVYRGARGAIIGGTGVYRGARGQFSFTEPASGVLDITPTLLPQDRRSAG
jgi:hypothetical protein